jgi:hypothetical protein
MPGLRSPLFIEASAFRSLVFEIMSSVGGFDKSRALVGVEQGQATFSPHREDISPGERLLPCEMKQISNMLLFDCVYFFSLNPFDLFAMGYLQRPENFNVTRLGLVGSMGVHVTKGDLYKTKLQDFEALVRFEAIPYNHRWVSVSRFFSFGIECKLELHTCPVHRSSPTYRLRNTVAHRLSTASS